MQCQDTPQAPVRATCYMLQIVTCNMLYDIPSDQDAASGCSGRPDPCLHIFLARVERRSRCASTPGRIHCPQPHKYVKVAPYCCCKAHGCIPRGWRLLRPQPLSNAAVLHGGVGMGAGRGRRRQRVQSRAQKKSRCLESREDGDG